MFDKLIELLSSSTATTANDLNDAEVRVAAAALLVHTARIDGQWTDDEGAQLTELLRQRFNLTAEELYTLLGSADEAEREAVDLYRFTSVLTRHLDQDGRQQIVEMLWSVVLADGVIHEFEDNLVWRVAELLGVSTRDRIRLKKLVQSRIGANAQGQTADGHPPASDPAD